MDFQDKAKQIAVDYYNAHKEISRDAVDRDKARVLWFVKSNVRWKGLVILDEIPSIYFEMEHDVRMQRTDVKVYKYSEELELKDET